MLFVDEIHRFNRAQLDAFLPVMEDGTITLVGATTENPSFELNAALLSRARVLVFKSLDEDAIRRSSVRAEEITGKRLPLDEEARASLVRMADGDGRAVLTLAEEVWRSAKPGEVFDAEALQEIIQRRAPIYDKGQEGHYNLISALHKTIRGSDPDAAFITWPGCSMPARIGCSSPAVWCGRPIEDIGLADPQALVIANAAKEAFDFLGSPEGELALAQAAVYLATAPKSNAALHGLQGGNPRREGAWLPHAAEDDPERPDEAHEADRLRRELRYDHDEPDAFSGQDYWPESSGGRSSTSRWIAASSARSGSGWIGGRGCARNGARGPAGDGLPSVFLGAGIGGALRHGVNLGCARYCGTHFPGARSRSTWSGPS